jgi:hypothetical protein
MTHEAHWCACPPDCACRCVAVKVLQLPEDCAAAAQDSQNQGSASAAAAAARQQQHEHMAVMEAVLSVAMAHPNIVQVRRIGHCSWPPLNQSVSHR